MNRFQRRKKKRRKKIEGSKPPKLGNGTLILHRTALQQCDKLRKRENLLT